MNKPYQVCKRCIMDTSDPEIVFDSDGICNHCKNAHAMLKTEPFCLSAAEKKQQLEALAARIRLEGKDKKYDCVIGLSGGVDSSYVAYKTKELGLRPLAVHLDNGWNSELSVKNIENICKRLGIDLYTHVINWEEFKDLQLAFLKASTPDSEIPSDHAIVSILYQRADREKVKYILGGTNLSSESIMPRTWSQGHADWKYIKALHAQFGSVPLKTFPHRSRLNQYSYRFIKGIEWVHVLNYFDYDKEKAKKELMDKIGFRDYGGKHHESNYTKIYQAYILPEKFGYDKRKAHLSSLICAGQISREKALEIMMAPLYQEKLLEEDIIYLVNKFNISKEQFERIMTAEPKRFEDYPHYTESLYIMAGRKLWNLFKKSRGVRS